MGIRWAFNDINGCEILWIASEDLDNGNNWKVEADLRGDYLQLEVRRYF